MPENFKKKEKTRYQKTGENKGKSKKKIIRKGKTFKTQKTAKNVKNLTCFDKRILTKKNKKVK